MSNQQNTIDIKQIEPTRQLNFKIFRYNPADPNDKPRWQNYQLEEADTMTLFIALNELRENQDPTLQFDFVCRAGICGSCAMLINGKPALACRTLTKDLPATIELAPLPSFALIGDLSVDTGQWMEHMSQRLETWIHTQQTKLDLTQMEQKMEPQLARDIYEQERCIECGCCLAACGNAQMNPDFVGAVGMLQLSRFTIDPRDTRTNADYYRVLGDENGVFGCLSLLGCEDSCPKDLPLAQQIAYMRKKLALGS
jgi:fumarate reductase iron-sulfur subunit